MWSHAGDLSICTSYHFYITKVLPFLNKLTLWLFFSLLYLCHSFYCLLPKLAKDSGMRELLKYVGLYFFYLLSSSILISIPSFWMYSACFCRSLLTQLVQYPSSTVYGLNSQKPRTKQLPLRLCALELEEYFGIIYLLSLSILTIRLLM